MFVQCVGLVDPIHADHEGEVPGVPGFDARQGILEDHRVRGGHLERLRSGQEGVRRRLAVQAVFLGELGVHPDIEQARDLQQWDIGLEILLDRLPKKSQAIEHALLLASLNIIDISGGAARVRQVSLRAPPVSAPSVYRAAFGCDVLFGAEADGLTLEEKDLVRPIIDPDEQIYEIATSFIADHYPPGTPPMHARVRGLVNRYLGSQDCTNERIAAELCMHPRTLQRRLKGEGKTFESIKEEVRREVVLRYLQRLDMPLTEVAEKLGYAEQSVLSRSCYRWFAASPRELRERTMADGANNEKT